LPSLTPVYSQIDQLLQSITPKSSKPARAPLEAFLLKLHDHLQNLPSLTPAQPAQAAAKLKEEGISVPFPSPPPTEETNWKFEFVRPVGITVVGSWALDMCVKRNDGEWFTVDLVVEMPPVCLLDAEKYPYPLKYAVGDTPGKGLPQRSVLSQTCTVPRPSGNENIERFPGRIRV
jgi:hypothetical protein